MADVFKLAKYASFSGPIFLFYSILNFSKPDKSFADVIGHEVWIGIINPNLVFCKSRKTCNEGRIFWVDGAPLSDQVLSSIPVKQHLCRLLYTSHVRM